MTIRNNFGLICLAFMMIFTSCGQNTPGQQSAQYKLLEIKLSDVNLSTNYSASIKGKQDIKIIPRVDGYLTTVCVNEGSKVKEGQTLFIIDQVPYKALLEGAKANVAVCEAAVSTARLTFDSKRNLREKEIVSDFDLRSAENGLKTAEAQLALAKSQLITAQNNLSYTVIKSPSNGVVGKLPYRKGDYVSPTMQQGLTMVADNSQMYVYFSMTESKIFELRGETKDMDAMLAALPEVELKLSNQSTYEHKGRVESISGIVDEATGSVSVRAVFPNEGGYLLSGGAGNVIMPYDRTEVIIIPQEATYEVQNMVYVYKVVEGEAKSAIVEVEKINNGKEYIVNSGLTAGDIIIAEGAGLVREGTKVTAKQNQE